MNYEYKKILPEDVYVTIFDREASEEELWKGLPRNFGGNRPTDNNFIDLFARLVRSYQHAEVKFYAAQMNVNELHFNSAIQALTGISAKEWRTRYILLSACELLKSTDMSITEIAKRLNFTSITVFSRFFMQHTKLRPIIWRSRNKGQTEQA